MSDLSISNEFIKRHIGPTEAETSEMLKTIKADSIDALIAETVPSDIRLKEALKLPKAISEQDFLTRIKELASNNQVFKSYIGKGYYGTNTPTVIQRNILENPSWYTAYTPYQAEIAQGRLEALINFQTVVTELTGMEIANASLLDEGTAASEAMTLLFHTRKGKKKSANKFFASKYCHPQTLDVLKTRAQPLGIELVIEDEKNIDFKSNDLFGDQYFGILLQYPNTLGSVSDYSEIINDAKNNGAGVILAADLLALTLLKSPAELGAEIVVGTTQRFGVPMGFGGPHAAFFATKDEYKRQLPGRIIGASIDANGNPAFRMALQTREQHIRREKATSNICTSQVLLAVMASFYAVYHGPTGLKKIARRVHAKTNTLAEALKALQYEVVNNSFFDTITFKCDADVLVSIAENEQINFYFEDEKTASISLDESVTDEDLERVIFILKKAKNKSADHIDLSKAVENSIPSALQRTTDYLQQEVFNKYHSEHEMLRYIKRLESKDLSLAHSMIALGSCTMKLNASTEMFPITWPEFSSIHPFVPEGQISGYKELFKRLNQWLCEITGFSKVSFQPNSGAQGEYAGLLVIRDYLRNKGEAHRNIALIPSSAHGTNPASAVMAGMKVVVTACDDKGNIDLEDLASKIKEHEDKLACLMVTYPSTHGVFESSIRKICSMVHEAGGQVYMDGANMNAQVGLTSPANIGADVCHLNLHKTFCIPHGGGGPGVGPIGVAAHLVPFLPGHIVSAPHTSIPNNSAVSAAPYGSAGILPIPYAYMMMMGGEGLKQATEYAILNANYLMTRLKEHYPVLYTGENGRCAHEFIIDFRAFKHSHNIEVEDIAKRLMDYGFHAPTVSFPVAGTLMVEPTESESKSELDRFCEALIAIREEIKEIEQGIYSKEDNVLKCSAYSSGYYFR